MSNSKLPGTAEECCQTVMRCALAGRDALLFAVNSKVDTATLRSFCRRMADLLGGQAADLSQLLAAHGCQPLPANDPSVDRLRAALVEEIAARGSSRARTRGRE